MSHARGSGLDTPCRISGLLAPCGTGGGRWLGVLAAGLLLPIAASLATPRRHVVDGSSMAPGLLPGDVISSGWLPLGSRVTGPRRFDRWIVTLPDGTAGLKRVVGLPGETVSIVDGDLRIDGVAPLKAPSLLAAVGSRVETDPHDGLGATAWTLPPMQVLDEAPAADLETSRLLLPVHDVGFAAVVTVASTTRPVRVRAVVGSLAITWRLTASGGHAVVAGRLDGHIVAAAWPLPFGPDAAAARSCLPPGAPHHWDVVRPWPQAAGMRPDDHSPALRLEVETDDPAAPATVRGIGLWRDILHRPAADGRCNWPLAGDEVFLLGDFPSGSRDSRHFGPVPLAGLRHRVAHARTHARTP